MYFLYENYIIIQLHIILTLLEQLHLKKYFLTLQVKTSNKFTYIKKKSKSILLI